ncbi:MAG: hypothetical protein ABSG07_20935 [Terriglobales bacterium]|jgi:hypothetical protein
MHRRGSGFLLTLAITFMLAFTGCLGKSSGNGGNGGVQTVSLNPNQTISIDVGGTQVFTAAGKDANGHTVLGVNIQFVVVSGSPNSSSPLSIASNGNACAGTWDASVSICSPGTSGIALVTAVIEGVSSPPTTVYVHQHINSLQISNAESQSPQYDCFSQGQTWQFEATAYSGNPPVDITSSVGPIDWASNPPGVVTTSTYVPPNEPNVLNQIQTTAAAPGITQLYASVSGTTSAPIAFTTCLIQSIYLQIANQGQAGNSITVNNGESVTITATAVDTLYKKANVTPLVKPPLTWSTTNPEIAAFATITNTTATNTATARSNIGGATLTASCTPPSCNIGVLPSLPIYASDCLPTSSTAPCELPNGTAGYGTISVDVTLPTGSTEPVYTAWAATTDCQNQPGCASALFAVKPGTNPIGSIVALPRTPNSMMFNHQSTARLYFGTNQGLMYVNVGGASPSAALVSSSPTPCNVSLCGTVLTISNDGKLVVVSDTVSTPSQVYIYNGSSSGVAPVDLIIPGETATAAAFSPDQLKLFILTNAGNMYVYSTVDALSSFSPIATSVTNVIFSADGSFGYVAGTPGATSVSGFATCDTPTTNVLSGVTTKAVPLVLYPSPTFQLDSQGDWTQIVVALDPPYVDTFGVNVAQVPLPYNQFACTPPSVSPNLSYSTSSNLGQGDFTPIYSQLVNDGTEMIVVAQGSPNVFIFNVSNGTTTSVGLNDPLGGNSVPLAASASTDGTQVYVAACDQYKGTTCSAGSVHIICTSSCTTGQGDYQQVPYANINQDNNPNMCNGQGAGAPLCLPNLIAIQPK